MTTTVARMSESVEVYVILGLMSALLVGTFAMGLVAARSRRH